jgi:hypothetical protein
LVKHHVVEQHDHRPDKKVYETKEELKPGLTPLAIAVGQAHGNIEVEENLR